MGSERWSSWNAYVAKEKFGVPRGTLAERVDILERGKPLNSAISLLARALA
jgi:hypothetical protein